MSRYIIINLLAIFLFASCTMKETPRNTKVIILKHDSRVGDNNQLFGVVEELKKGGLEDFEEVSEKDFSDKISQSFW